MALIKVNGKYKLFDICDSIIDDFYFNDFNLSTLTLTEEDYLDFDTSKYDALITEKRIIIKRYNIEIINSYPCIDYVGEYISGEVAIYIHTRCNTIIVRDNIPKEIIYDNIRYDDEIKLKHKSITEYGLGSNHNEIYYDAGEYYFKMDGMHVKLEHIVDNLVTHLYYNEIFIGSAFRNNSDDLMVIKRKIIEHREFHNHLLVKHRDNRHYLILLSYSSLYEFPYDDVPLKIPTKSARK